MYLYIFACKVNQTHYFTTERSNFFIKILINRLLLTVYHSTRDNVSFEQVFLVLLCSYLFYNFLDGEPLKPCFDASWSYCHLDFFYYLFFRNNTRYILFFFYSKSLKIDLRTNTFSMNKYSQYFHFRKCFSISLKKFPGLLWANQIKKLGQKQGKLH